jgi:hypothetical protein
MPARATVEPEADRPHIGGMSAKPNEPTATAPPPQPDERPAEPPPRPKEIGGPKGPEPTRYGDWEYNGRCTDF